MEATDVDREPNDPTVRIGVLPTARRRPVSVRPNDPIAKAKTVMSMEDFSQLPVMVSDREVKGVISWRSIVSASIREPRGDEVRHYMEAPPRVISVRDPFFEAIDDICEHGYVLVRDMRERISGIVTASDFARQFAQLAHPFLVIGEIELHLRNLVSRFTIEEMKAASDNQSRQINGPADLTFGDYCRLLEDPKGWKKLGLDFDRATFLDHLNRVREARNDIVHFAPDGLDPEDIQRLERIALFLRKLTQH